jgi:hypothetical protein
MAAAPAGSRLAALHGGAAAVDAARQEPVNRAALRGALQTYGNLVSFTGDADGALAALDEAMQGTPQGGNLAELGALGDARADDAIRVIVETARDKRAVLINESHHQPMNRAFTQKLAAELRKIGYTYLAAEAFGEPVASQPRYATPAHGYYVQEPAFAALVNAALADGWTLVPYDTTRVDQTLEMRLRMRQRELDAANLLYQRIFARDPQAKALIHVGYGHLYKESAPAGIQMGTLLRQKLGEGATLHVDQTPFFAHPDRSREHVLYRPLLAKFGATTPFIVRRADGAIVVFASMQSRVDMQVVFPDYGTVAGRPGWMTALAGRTPYPVPAALWPASGKRLVTLHADEHGADAVPLDAVVVEAGMPAPPLMAPAGALRLSFEE